MTTTATTTFQYQGQLPKLPVPDLITTCKNYLQVLKPLQTENEHLQTIQLVEDFIKTTGPKLDEHLRSYAQSRDSYIEQFWYDSYLNYDSPVVLNLNPFILLEDDPTPLQSNQVTRLTSLTLSSLKFVRLLRRNELPPDKLKNGAALDMDQYPKLFGSARIPSNTGCQLQTDQQSRHVVVISKSQFYWFEVLDEQNDLILTEHDIKQNFKNILRDSETINNTDIAKSSFGVLTTENRRIWANLRQEIHKDDINRDILTIIDNALFIVCLDDVEIDDLESLAKNYLCGTSFLRDGIQIGTCTNRWYDKIQIIVTKNAKAGINFEHTGVDGHTVLRFASDIYTDSILRFAKTINNNSPSLWASVSPDPKIKDPKGGVQIKTPRKLDWNLTNTLSLSLRFAETRLSDLIHQNEFAALDFNEFGMEKIKKMGFSPDAFVQMSFQLAYYALYGKVECTYEPAMTKQFLHGRTEAIRTVSMESIDFVTNFFKEDISNVDKMDFLKKACGAHSKRTRECSKGLGQDRHLYALFCVWQRYFSQEGVEDTEMQRNGSMDSDSTSTSTLLDSEHTLKLELKDIPSIFADNGWDRLNNTVLSTSNCGNPSLKLFGFGPVSSNGFGIGYIIKDNSISICASSKHRQTKRFLDTLNDYLIEVERIYQDSLRDDEQEEEEGVVGLTADMLRQATVPIFKRHNLARLFGGYEIDAYQVDKNPDLIKSRAASPEPGFNDRVSHKLRLSEY